MLSEKTLSRIRSLGLDAHSYMTVCEIVHDAMCEKETAQNKTKVALQIPADWPPDYQSEFWGKYLNKTAKPRAMKALDKVAFSGKTRWADLMAGLERYNICDKVRKGFVKNPATWINDEDWNAVSRVKPSGTNGRPLGFFELIARGD